MYSMPRIPKNCCRQLPNSRTNRMLKNWQEPHRAEAREAFAKLPSGAGRGEQVPLRIESEAVAIATVRHLIPSFAPLRDLTEAETVAPRLADPQTPLDRLGRKRETRMTWSCETIGVGVNLGRRAGCRACYEIVLPPSSHVPWEAPYRAWRQLACVNAPRQAPLSESSPPGHVCQPGVHVVSSTSGSGDASKTACARGSQHRPDRSLRLG